MVLSVRIVVQMDEKLRQKADVEKTVTCNVPDQMMEMDINTKDGKKMFRYVENTMTVDWQPKIWFSSFASDQSGTEE